MKRVILSSYSYKGQTMYQDSSGFHIFTGPKGTGRIEFETDSEAEEFIDDSIDSEESADIDNNSTISLNYVVGRISTSELNNSYSKYMWLQPDGKYKYGCQGTAKKMTKDEASQIIKDKKTDDRYIYQMIQVSSR